jgi:hypothetical protein
MASATSGKSGVVLALVAVCVVLASGVNGCPSTTYPVLYNRACCDFAAHMSFLKLCCLDTLSMWTVGDSHFLAVLPLSFLCTCKVCTKNS